jgi:hypothetical protein
MSLPCMNPAWSDPALQHAVGAIADGNPAPVRDLLSVAADPDRRELYTKMLGVASRRQLKQLRELVVEAEDDPHALLLLGCATVQRHPQGSRRFVWTTDGGGKVH